MFRPGAQQLTTTEDMWGNSVISSAQKSPKR